MLIDATVVRGVILPAALAVLGERAWYLPRWLAWLPGRRLAEGEAAARTRSGPGVAIPPGPAAREPARPRPVPVRPVRPAPARAAPARPAPAADSAVS